MKTKLPKKGFIFFLIGLILMLSFQYFFVSGLNQSYNSGKCKYSQSRATNSNTGLNNISLIDEDETNEIELEPLPLVSDFLVMNVFQWANNLLSDKFARLRNIALVKTTPIYIFNQFFRI